MNPKCFFLLLNYFCMLSEEALTNLFETLINKTPFDFVRNVQNYEDLIVASIIKTVQDSLETESVKTGVVALEGSEASGKTTIVTQLVNQPSAGLPYTFALDKSLSNNLHSVISELQMQYNIPEYLYTVAQQLDLNYHSYRWLLDDLLLSGYLSFLGCTTDNSAQFLTQLQKTLLELFANTVSEAERALLSDSDDRILVYDRYRLSSIAYTLAHTTLLELESAKVDCEHTLEGLFGVLTNETLIQTVTEIAHSKLLQQPLVTFIDRHKRDMETAIITPLTRNKSYAFVHIYRIPPPSVYDAIARIGLYTQMLVLRTLNRTHNIQPELENQRPIRNIIPEKILSLLFTFAIYQAILLDSMFDITGDLLGSVIRQPYRRFFAIVD